MTDNVIGLRGHVPSIIGKVDENVVAQIKSILEKAEAGKIDGVGIVYHKNDQMTNRCYSGVLSYSLLGRLFELQQMVLTDLKT